MTSLDIRRFICATALTAGIATPGASQSVGDCQTGQASADLDINNVSARLYNNGGLFWRGGTGHYNVPKSTSSNAIFTQQLWIGGLIDGELHMAASDYGPWEFWPGPIDETGNPPEDCDAYDRMYSIRRSDIERYEQSGELTDDLRDWPFDLGAPVADGDGNPDNYNLAGGDRPDMIGDQMVWWIINDLGNRHTYSLVEPLHLEMRVTAYAFQRPARLGYTTFYRYELVNKGSEPIEGMYFAPWVDSDLGDATDDYIGCDSTLGLGYTYNGDEFDGGADGYGDRPPALGYVFVEGPLVAADGIDNDHDGLIDEPGERLSMTTFVYYQSDSTVQGNPRNGENAYTYLRGLWLDDVPITYGGNGRGYSNEPTHFMYPADPPAFWSEEDIDNHGSRNQPADRRFLTVTGPFTMAPGQTQEITYAIVFSQGQDRLDSVRELKKDAAYVQSAFDGGFRSASPPDAPVVSAKTLDGTVILNWKNDSGSNNYLDSYDVPDPYLAKSDVDDRTYTLEGYNVFRFASQSDLVGYLVATFDRNNGVKRVIDIISVDDQTGTASNGVTADGTDSGIRHAYAVDTLTNYTTYHFGVQAYAYNPNSEPKIIKSAVTRISAEPAAAIARRGGTIPADSTYGRSLTLENGGITKAARGEGTVEATIVDPLEVTGHTYRLEYFESAFAGLSNGTLYPVSYDVTDETTGQPVFDGRSVETALGHPTPLGENVLQLDGLSLSLFGPEAGPYDIDGTEAWAFVQVQGGEGIHPDACDQGAVSSFGCAQVGGNWVYGSFNGRGDWIMGAWGTGPEGSIGFFAPNDYEIRATDEVSYGYFYFSSGNVITVPAEIWDIGPTGPFGVNDPSDDVRMIPVLYSDDGGECYFGFGETEDGPFALGWPGTDRIYAYYPVAGATYADWEAAAKPLVEADPKGCPTSPVTDVAAQLIDLDHDRPLQRLAWQMNPESPDYRPEFIPVGNVIRFLTTKPNLPGDKFFIHTESYAPKTHDLPTAKAALDLIGIVPNPYKGASDYEITATRDVVRFTNLPDVATIRIFNLGGTLITTLEKTPATTGLEWDLTNDNGYHIASGMYLVHVEVPGVGERVVKFGVVKKSR